MKSLLPTRIENGYQFGNFVAEKLPERQAQTLLLMAAGCGEKKSAQLMNCSISNVRQLKQVLYFKLNAHSPTEIIAKAFATTHLRLASLLIAIFLGISAPTVADHDALARLVRTRPTQLRARNSGRTRNGNGLYWSPETNELVWS